VQNELKFSNELYTNCTIHCKPFEKRQRFWSTFANVCCYFHHKGLRLLSSFLTFKTSVIVLYVRQQIERVKVKSSSKAVMTDCRCGGWISLRIRDEIVDLLPGTDLRTSWPTQTNPTRPSTRTHAHRTILGSKMNGTPMTIAVFFNLFIGIELFGEFRLLAEPHAVISKGFTLFQNGQTHHFMYLVTHDNDLYLG